jgi:hypothetical protein
MGSKAKAKAQGKAMKAATAKGKSAAATSAKQKAQAKKLASGKGKKGDIKQYTKVAHHTGPHGAKWQLTGVKENWICTKSAKS